MARQEESASVLMLDLDHFQVHQRPLGHGMGDSVLETASERLRTQLREVDVLSRWGGEEFIVLLPRTPPGGGRRGGRTPARVAQRPEPAGLAGGHARQRVDRCGALVAGPGTGDADRTSRPGPVRGQEERPQPGRAGAPSRRRRPRRRQPRLLMRRQRNRASMRSRAATKGDSIIGSMNIMPIQAHAHGDGKAQREDVGLRGHARDHASTMLTNSIIAISGSGDPQAHAKHFGAPGHRGSWP